MALNIYESTFSASPIELDRFVTELFTTAHGWVLIILGNGVGALFALLAFTVSVVSYGHRS